MCCLCLFGCCCELIQLMSSNDAGSRTFMTVDEQHLLQVLSKGM
jgi:hypothetical protein